MSIVFNTPPISSSMCYNQLMNEYLLSKLKETTEEEAEILAGKQEIDANLYISPGTISDYPSAKNFVIDAKRLLEKGRLIEIRRHTRFAHFPTHKHNYVELVYMYTGKTTHFLNGNDELVLETGDLLFLNQNATQEILPADADDVAVNFIILPEFFDQAIRMLPEQNVLRDFLISALSGDGAFSYIHFKAKDILPIQNLMENMIWNLVEKKKETNQINLATMNLVIMNLASFATEINNSQPEQLEQRLVFAALKYIETHYKNGTLQELAEELQEPTYYISRLLKKHTESNFKELLQKRKLQQAAYLLSNTTLTTERIMEAIGYDNSSYFHRKFKETYGMSPKTYRNKYH